MANIDRIPHIPPTMLQTQPASEVQMRKEGRRQTPDQPQRDTVELHEESTSEVDIPPTFTDDSDHGLDLTA
jgi:hypothetical protein